MKNVLAALLCAVLLLLAGCAGLTAEKQPEAVFSIMEEVIKQQKDAKLLLLGDFDAPKWKKLAAEKGISDSVSFCGMVSS